jgi:hypothetical protein
MHVQTNTKPWACSKVRRDSEQEIASTPIFPPPPFASCSREAKGGVGVEEIGYALLYDLYNLTLYICGILPQNVVMSKSIRLSDELIEVAKEHAERFHRSPPQQIEHWAEIGRVLEPTLTYQVASEIKSWGSKQDIDDLMDEIDSEKGMKHTQSIIDQTSGHV